MKGGGKIEDAGGRADASRLSRRQEALHCDAERGDDIHASAADEQKKPRREAAQVYDAVFVLLDDFNTVATAGAAAQITCGRERGVGENEDGGGRSTSLSHTGDETAEVVRDSGLMDAGDGCQG